MAGLDFEGINRACGPISTVAGYVNAIRKFARELNELRLLVAAANREETDGKPRRAESSLRAQRRARKNTRLLEIPLEHSEIWRLDDLPKPTTTSARVSRKETTRVRQLTTT